MTHTEEIQQLIDEYNALDNQIAALDIAQSSFKVNCCLA